MLELIPASNMDFQNVLNYYNSFDKPWVDLNCFAIYQVNVGESSYYDYISRYEKNLFYLVNSENPNYIIGFGTIDDSKIIDYHKEYLNVGNIGYGVRPSERNKGYGSKLLNLILLECEKMGMNEVCVSCLKDNMASNKVILNNHGKLEKEFFDEDSGKYGLKYWIKLHPKLSVKIRRYIKK